MTRNEIINIFEKAEELFDEDIVNDVVDFIMDNDREYTEDDVFELYYNIEAERYLDEQDYMLECGFDPYMGDYSYDC